MARRAVTPSVLVVLIFLLLCYNNYGHTASVLESPLTSAEHVNNVRQDNYTTVITQDVTHEVTTETVLTASATTTTVPEVSSTEVTVEEEEEHGDWVGERGILLGATTPAAEGGRNNDTLPWWKRWPYPLRQQAARPCQCEDFTCGCCAGISIERLNISQRGCLNFKYDPDEFAIEMEMLMNDKALVQRSVSAKNPPPLCIPIPSPASFIPRVEFCTRLFNIFTPGRNLHMCLDWSTRVNSSPVLEVQFDCLRMGADGVAVVKPDAGGGLGPEVPGGAGGGGGGGGDYGPVIEGAQGGEDYDPLDPEDPEKGNKKPSRKPTKPPGTANSTASTTQAAAAAAAADNVVE